MVASRIASSPPPSPKQFTDALKGRLDRRVTGLEELTLMWGKHAKENKHRLSSPPAKSESGTSRGQTPVPSAEEDRAEAKDDLLPVFADVAADDEEMVVQQDKFVVPRHRNGLRRSSFGNSAS